MKKSITIAALIGTAMLVHAEIKEVKINGSFESLDSKNMPAKWENNQVFKAEENLKAKSLKVYADTYRPKVAVRTSMSDYRRESWLLNLPLYAISQLLEECKAFQTAAVVDKIQSEV